MPSSSTARKGASGQRRQAGSAGPRARQAGNGHAKSEHAENGHAGNGRGGIGGIKMPAMPAVMHVPGGTAGNVLWWGGLAAMAAFGVVDWPVAALVAAGTWVAEQHVRQAARARDAARAG